MLKKINGVYTVFILIVEDCSGILLQMHAMLSCITFWHSYIISEVA